MTKNPETATEQNPGPLDLAILIDRVSQSMIRLTGVLDEITGTDGKPPLGTISLDAFSGHTANAYRRMQQHAVEKATTLRTLSLKQLAHLKAMQTELAESGGTPRMAADSTPTDESDVDG